MKTIYRNLCACLLFAPLASMAQTTYQKAIGGTANDIAYDIDRTSDGAFVIAGETVDPDDFNANIFLVKITDGGDTLWTRSIGGAPWNESAVSARGTNDGGVIVCSNSSGNILLTKIDDQGVISWSRSFGTPNNDELPSMAQQTADGGFIAVGTITVDVEPSDIFLIKTDANGDTTWTRTLNTGPDHHDGARAVVQTGDGGYLITGEANQFGVFQGMSLIRTDMNGDVLWAKSINNFNLGYDVERTSDGGYVVLGSHYSTSYDIYLVRLDALGDTLWTRRSGGPASEYAYSVEETSDGGFVLAGATSDGVSGSALLVRTDMNGDPLWSSIYGTTNYDGGTAARSTDDGGFMIAGGTYGFGPGQSSVYIIRTDAVGNSGCNETSVATSVHVPAVTIIDLVVTAYSGTTVSSPAFPVIAGSQLATACLTMNVRETAADELLLTFPNPSSGSIPITTSRPIQTGQYELVDLGGKLIRQGSINDASGFVIHCEDVGPGAYFLRVFDGRESHIAKLVVEPR